MRRTNTKGPYVAFYGDDFTGSTDALWQFAQFGLRTRLLLRAPTDFAEIDCTDIDVLGIAGVTRSLPTPAIEPQLLPILQGLRTLGPVAVQYKACSTLDSSAATGNLGRVIELGRRVFGGTAVPVAPAQPDFGRYTVFGTHFATSGGEVYRLDRHPTMAVHPITPMLEADVVRLLTSQAPLAGALTDIRALRGESLDVLKERFRADTATADFVVFDTLSNRDLLRAAEIILSQDPSSTRFVVGSGGLSRAIGHYMVTGGGDAPPTHVFATEVGAAERMLVVSGSCSPCTAEQIDHARGAGWSAVPLEIAPFLQPVPGTEVLQALEGRVLSALAQSRGVIVHTALGPDDDAIGRTQNAVTQLGLTDVSVLAALGRAFARVIEVAVRQGGVTRVAIAGGDTSGWTVRELDVDSLEVVGLAATGAPLCELRSADSTLNGLQIVLKGGQVGSAGLFEDMRRGLMEPTEPSAQ